MTAPAQRHRPRVVVVGAGFGGLAAARQLGRADVELTVAVPEALCRAPDA